MLRRKSASSAAASDAGGTAVGTVPVPEGKGRPTPKRRDVERNRRTPVTGGTRGSGKAARMTARERREAMARGDEAAMLPRDRGPVKKFARDYVDSRRHVGEYFMPAAMLIVLLQFVNVQAVVMIAMFFMLALFIAVGASAFRLRRNVLAEVARRFPGSPTRGVAMYAIMRSTQFRRLRMPAPQVARGTKI